MQLFQHKKALLLGALMTALSINLAFAEESPTQPTMAEKVQRILNAEENSNEELAEARSNGYYHHRRNCGPRRGCDYEHGYQQHHSKEEIAHYRQERQERIHEAMRELTPAQRREVERFIAKDRAYRQERHAAIQDMTQEQREAVRAHYYGRHHKRSGYHHGHGCYRD